VSLRCSFSTPPSRVVGCRLFFFCHCRVSSRASCRQRTCPAAAWVSAMDSPQHREQPSLVVRLATTAGAVAAALLPLLGVSATSPTGSDAAGALADARTGRRLGTATEEDTPVRLLRVSTPHLTTRDTGGAPCDEAPGEPRSARLAACAGGTKTGRSDTPCEDAAPSHHIFAISRGDFATEIFSSPTPCEEALSGMCVECGNVQPCHDSLV